MVISKQFENKPLLDRHRMVNSVLADELKNGVHALSIEAKTPEQWEESGQAARETPACMGGSKHDRK